MVAATSDQSLRLTDLYVDLMIQWARQTMRYSRSVRLYQERLSKQRERRLGRAGHSAQPALTPRRQPVHVVVVDGQASEVTGPSLDLVGPPPPALAEPTTAGTLCPLTARQREIAELIAEGLTNSQIAARIVVSRGTVGNHIGHMLRRLGVKNRAQIAAWAIRQGTGDRG